MMLMILSHTPIWVWMLLALLLALGLWQQRDRNVRRGQLLALPLALLVLGLWSMAPGFVALPLAAVCWLVSISAFVWLGTRLPRAAAARWLPEQRRLFVPGSWVPMLLIVSSFSLRYATGVGHGLHPEWRGQLQVQVPLALVFGALSGLFLGRAIALLRLARAAGAEPRKVGRIVDERPDAR